MSERSKIRPNAPMKDVVILADVARIALENFSMDENQRLPRLAMDSINISMDCNMHKGRTSRLYMCFLRTRWACGVHVCNLQVTCSTFLSIQLPYPRLCILKRTTSPDKQSCELLKVLIEGLGSLMSFILIPAPSEGLLTWPLQFFRNHPDINSKSPYCRIVRPTKDHKSTYESETVDDRLDC